MPFPLFLQAGTNRGAARGLGPSQGQESGKVQNLTLWHLHKASVAPGQDWPGVLFHTYLLLCRLSLFLNFWQPQQSHCSGYIRAAVVRKECLCRKCMNIMTSHVCFSWKTWLDFCQTAFSCGNKIAYCSANSITLESPYHFLRSCRSLCGAPWCWDHHHLTLASVFEIKGGVLLGETGWRRSNWIVCCLLLFLLLTGYAAIMESSDSMVEEGVYFPFPFLSPVNSYLLLTVFLLPSTHLPDVTVSPLNLSLPLSLMLLQHLHFHLFCRPTITFSNFLLFFLRQSNLFTHLRMNWSRVRCWRFTLRSPGTFPRTRSRL